MLFGEITMKQQVAKVNLMSKEHKCGTCGRFTYEEKNKGVCHRMLNATPMPRNDDEECPVWCPGKLTNEQIVDRKPSAFLSKEVTVINTRAKKKSYYCEGCDKTVNINSTNRVCRICNSRISKIIQQTELPHSVITLVAWTRDNPDSYIPIDCCKSLGRCRVCSRITFLYSVHRCLACKRKAIRSTGICD